MKLILKIADKSEIKSLQLFFSLHLNEKTPWIVNWEFLCPFWVEGAVKRNQVVILKNGLKIIWALRFYPRKRDNLVSVYLKILKLAVF
jgi:hypothetical protein